MNENGKENKDKKNKKGEGNHILPFHWEFGEEEITLQVTSYAYGEGLAILMYHEEEGELELFGDLTVNLPGGYSLEPGEAFISGDFTKEKLAFIRENRLGKVLPETVRSGYASYTLVAFDFEKLAWCDREGVAEFCRNWGIEFSQESVKERKEKSDKKKKRERER